MKLSTTTPAGNGVLVRLDLLYRSMHQVCTISRKAGISQRCFRFPCAHAPSSTGSIAFGRSACSSLAHGWLIPFKKRRTNKRTELSEGGERDMARRKEGRNSGKTCALCKKAALAPLQTCAGNNKGIIYQLPFVSFRSVLFRLGSQIEHRGCRRHFRRFQMLMPT